MHSLDYIKAANAAAGKTHIGAAPAAVRPSTGEADACLANALFTVNEAYIGRHVVITKENACYGKIGEITDVTLTARDQDDIEMSFTLNVRGEDGPRVFQDRAECVVLRDAS